MKSSKRVLLAAAAAASVSIIGRYAHAGTNYTWTDLAGGTQSWTDTTQWNPTGNPVGAVNTGDGANLNVALTSSLFLNVPSGNYYVNSMQLGSTATPVTTDVGNANADGGMITFDDGPASLNIFADLLSGGVAGSTNIISAPIQFDQNGSSSQSMNGQAAGNTGNYVVNAMGSVNSGPLQAVQTGLAASVVIDKNSTTDLSLNGPISQIAGVSAAICNAMPTGRTLNINGNISIASSTVAQAFTLTGTSGSLTVVNGVIADGTTPNSTMSYGTFSPNKASIYPAITPTIQINSANTYTGITTLNMATLIIANNQALGVPTATGLLPPQSRGELRMGGSANQFGYNLEAANDSIAINNPVDVTQFLTIEGAHSITFNGYFYQTVARELVNILPAGKSMTMNGEIYINSTNSTNRTWDFDGSGLTVVNGSIHNAATGDTSVNAPLVKNGTGVVQVNGTASTYNGTTTVNGGLLEFATPGSYGVQTGDTGTSAITVNAGGAIALDSNAGGTAGSTDSTFVGLIAATSTGGLALSSLDANANIDFTSAPFSGRASMSVGSDYAGVTYNGTITPANSTYRLGGGGTLTLANSGGNALTGAGNNLVVTNGGTVAVNGSNDFGGTTTIQGLYLTTDQARATQNNFLAPTGAFEPVTLSVNNLANGGSASGIGSSSNAASNLVINGGTLQYTGSGASTDRLFTMNPNGATLDSSGTGAVDFANTLAIAQTDQAPMTGVTVTAPSGTAIVFNKLAIPSSAGTSNLSVGMTISDSLGAFPASTIVGVTANAVFLSNNITSSQSNDTLTFGNENRTLTLTGTNTGQNILSAAVTDSTLGKLAINKTGSGTWDLAGNNTYTGGTTINAGTLVMGTATSIPGNISVASGATLQLGTSIGGVQFTPSSLTIANGGTLDVNNDHVIINYGAGPDPIASIQAMLASGYAGGAWNGTGINSSAVAGNPGYAVGYADSADAGNPAGLASGTIEVAFTLAGDANLDHAVNGVDFGILAANFNKGITGWDKGDFNYDNAVNGVDFGLLAANFNKGASAASGGATAADFAALDAFAAANGLLADVPEPATIGLMLLGASGLMARRRRRA
jgi:fibronectin-binding autotransporter adhesin